MQSVPQNALIVYQDQYKAYWSKEGLYYQFTNKRYRIQDMVDYMAKYFIENQIPVSAVFNRKISEDVYMIDYHALNNSQGYVLLSKVSQVSGTRLKYEVQVDTARLFLNNSGTRYNEFQNYLLGNPQSPSNYLLEMRFLDNEVPAQAVTGKESIELEPATPGIQITAPQTGQAALYSITAQGNQPFIIKSMALTSQEARPE